jgi:hypothetical protein
MISHICHSEGFFQGAKPFLNHLGPTLCTRILRILLFFLISTYSSLLTLLFISLLILHVLYSSSSYSSILIFKLLVFSYYSSLLLNFYLFISSSSYLLMPHPSFLTHCHLKRGAARPSPPIAASLLLIRPLKIFTIYRTWAAHVKGFILSTGPQRL